ncbi:(2Fe-2S)-binding protein, partial [Streptomyces pathocidini]|uniref:(2Fe-2S)-binding protein n=1 Tax=Streptomyces pathocidini TaxID=1650571 RepID=UPI0033FF05E7
MSPRRVRAEYDLAGRQDRPLRITVDGEPVDGVAGQTIAGVLLAAGRLAWRRGRSGAPRGVFCGIGVCFDCLVTVGDERDVRACRRRARDGDAVTTQTREQPTARSGRAETAPETEAVCGSAVPKVGRPAVSGPAVSGPAVSGPAVSGPAVSGPAVSGPA